MTKFIKYLFFTLAGLVLLLILSVLAVVVFINPNHYKSGITEQFYKKTGYTLIINGDLHWTLFPWLGLSLQNITLNDLAHNTKPSATIEQATINVQFFPLLKGHIEMGNLELHHAVIHYKNADNHKDTTVSFKYFSSKNINGDGKAFPVRALIQIGIGSLNEPVMMKAQTDIAIDLDKERLLLSKIDIALKKLQLKGDITINHFLSDDINYKGHLFLPQFDAAKIITSIAPVKFENPKALHAITGHFSFMGGKNNIVFNEIKMTLDDAIISGRLNIVDIANNIIHFNLAIDELNVDNYKLIDVAKKRAAPVNASSNITQTTTADTSPEKTLAPRGDIKANLSIKLLTVNHLVFNNFISDLRYENGVLNLGPLKTELYGGNVKANLKTNFNTLIPQYTLNSDITGIQMNPLLTALNAGNILSGIGNINASLTSSGNTLQNILGELSGKADISLQDGTLKGFPFIQTINSAASLFFKQSTADYTDDLTAFSSVSATFHLNKGLANTPNFMLKSPLFDINGNGTINLATQDLDFALKIHSLGSAIPPVVRLEKTLGGSIPLIVTGTITHPKLRPDINALAKKETRHEIDHQIKKLGADLEKKGKKWGKQLQSLFK